MSLVDISRKLSEQMAGLKFSAPVAYVYNPLDYAWSLHEQYLEKYGQGPKKVMLLGMNPGPFGMAQSGVPFGDVTLIKDFLGISGDIVGPQRTHPKKPVLGLDCPRSEVSGTRLWSWVRDRFETPEAFFQDYFVVNYCPLLFLDEGGRNLTPDKIPVAERRPITELCNQALLAMIQCLQVDWVVGVGKWAYQQVNEALSSVPLEQAPQTGWILHPSPASPHANRGWALQAERQLKELLGDIVPS